MAKASDSGEQFGSILGMLVAAQVVLAKMSGRELPAGLDVKAAQPFVDLAMKASAGNLTDALNGLLTASQMKNIDIEFPEMSDSVSKLAVLKQPL